MSDQNIGDLLLEALTTLSIALPGPRPWPTESIESKLRIYRNMAIDRRDDNSKLAVLIVAARAVDRVVSSTADHTQWFEALSELHYALYPEERAALPSVGPDDNHFMSHDRAGWCASHRRPLKQCMQIQNKLLPPDERGVLPEGLDVPRSSRYGPTPAFWAFLVSMLIATAVAIWAFRALHGSFV